ncbi:hypothetical protein LT679_08575 [Mucilaginibacter roseus]|uniref:Porin n=1 Tax=Mucilaginibacter roseus TaxID=1528868 RepID=A0ABS8U0L1_9SPHI|nr:hypothetical protein [Mucilaginibacter roseus]MCD8740651.1 hypothetical protein [Mucilaginibacter roseus]
MKTLITILATLLCPILCVAQSNYREGYVIQNNGDTVKGYINVKEWDTNPQSISFKKSVADKGETKYTPLTVKSFTAGDYSYLAYIGHVSNNKNVFPDLDTYRDTTTRVDTVFLHELISGSKVSLYDKFQDNKRSFFYKEGNQLPVELIYYNYYEDGSTIRTLPVYISQVFELQKKYSGGDVRLTDFDRLNYRKDDLLKVFEKINGDGKRVHKSTGGHQFFAGLGGVVSQNRFVGDNQFITAGTVNSFSPRIHAGVDIFNNVVTKKLVLRTEVSFYYNKPTFAGADPIYTGAKNRQFYQFEQYNASITPQVVFSFYSTAAARIFASAGIGLNFSFYKNNRFYGDNNTTSYLNVPYKLERYWANFPLQLGAVIAKRYEVAFTYIPRAAYTNYVLFGVTSRVLGVNLRYHL